MSEYYFNENIANAAVNFFPKFLKLHKGNKYLNKPFVLEDWERKIVYELYGWRRKDNNTRKYKTCHIWLPARNGKTQFAAALICLEMFLFPDSFGEILTAANDRKQASISFHAVKEMIKSSKILRSKCKIFMRHILGPKNTIIRPISKESSTSQGYDCNFILLDELHELKDRDYYSTLISRFSNRDEYLFCTISTAGDGADTSSIGKEIYDLSKYTIANPESNPSTLAVVYEADEKDNWEDEKTWYKANPSLKNGIKKIEDMRNLYQNAKINRSLINSFKRYQLNQWCSKEDKFINLSEWMKCFEEFDLEKVKDLPCYLGYDLSSIHDYTSISTLFIDKPNEKYYVQNYFFIPEESIGQRMDEEKTPVDLWIEDGWITATSGSTVDYQVVKNKIIELYNTFNVQAIGYDPHNANELNTALLEEFYLPIIAVGQGIMNISEPTKEFERLIYNKNIVHNNNPLLNWQIGNCVAYSDANNNIKLKKRNKTSVYRIDGVYSILDALCVYMKNPNPVIPKIETCMLSL